MDENDAAEFLEKCAWKISMVMQSLDKCPHAHRRNTGGERNELCVGCMNLKTKLGLISMHLNSSPEDILIQGIEIIEAIELLSVLQDVCSWPQTKQPFQKIYNLLEKESYSTKLRRSILAYLKQPLFVVERLGTKCDELIQRFETYDSEDAMEASEPEDYSRAHKLLFPALRRYSRCTSCGLSQEMEGKECWHTTRLALMDITKGENDLIQFDVIISAITEKWWQDLCIRISSSAGRRVNFETDDEADQVHCLSLQKSTNIANIDNFCEILQQDVGCRLTLKLENNLLFEVDVEAPKHRTSPGLGLSLANVLEIYTFSVGEKLSLAHSIALAFWQFYDSQLMHRAWSSCTIWFMPEPTMLDNSERLPLRAYISFHTDITECEFDSSEFITMNSVIHRCPRIQSLAILLLEIGLGRPFRCHDFDYKPLRLNSRHSMALECLEELQNADWNFSHKYFFTDAVSDCLKLDGLMGKEPSSDNCDSHSFRRTLLYERVVARLDWLNKSFPKPKNGISYLAAKQPVQGLPQETYRETRCNPSVKAQSTWTIVTSPSDPENQFDLKNPTRPADRYAFEIVIMCALTLEADAVVALLDHNWEDYGSGYGKAIGDPNAYSTGFMGRHNVVIAHMAGMGKGAAAAAAANCKASFPNIKLALVVGICGAVPFLPGIKEKREIILGDIMVSEGIIQFDFGRKNPDGFTRKNTPQDSLGRPSFEVRGFLAKLKSYHSQNNMQKRMNGYLDMLQEIPGLNARYPGVHDDRLFKQTYRHINDTMECGVGRCRCELVSRNRLEQGATKPAIHFGLMASGDTVMKFGEERDKIAQRDQVIGFEMEGAGVWDNFSSVMVIKGACDYADSHKTKVWQNYAAATAAACTKALLDDWIPMATNVG